MTEKAVTTAALLRVLKHGEKNGQSVDTLAYLLDTTPRAVRKLTDELINEGTPVCALPATGYFIAQTWGEVDAVYDFLRERALHSLDKAAKVRGAFSAIQNPQSHIEEQAA